MYLMSNDQFLLFHTLISFTCSDKNERTEQVKSADDSNHTEEPLPRLMWCRDTFMEALNEIEDIN